MKIASIDIGTNTIRLLIAEVKNSSLKPVYQDREVVRLGEGLVHTGRLQQEPMKRALKVLKKFKEKCEEMQVDKIVAIATSAVREAENRKEFLELVEKEAGIKVKVITGEEEAYYTYLGVRYGLKLEKDFLVFDIGGGSTEYICCHKSGIKPTSTPLGVVKLTEAFIKSDLPKKEELNTVRREIKAVLSKLDMKECEGKTLVGTAGTPTTIAAIDLHLEEYDPEKVHGHKLSLSRIEEIFARLVKMPKRERLLIPGMERGREDLIIAGILITIETMKHFKADTMVVSEWGIREGVIIDEAGSALKAD